MAKCFWQKFHVIPPNDCQLLSSSLGYVVCQSSWNVTETHYVPICCPSGLNSFPLFNITFDWGFATVSRCNSQFCMDFWAGETKKCHSADLVESLKYIAKSESLTEILLRITVSTGLINLKCSGVTLETSAICFFSQSYKTVWLCYLLWLLSFCQQWLAWIAKSTNLMFFCYYLLECRILLRSIDKLINEAPERIWYHWENY